MSFVLQLLGSGIAVAALVGLVAWARIARPAPPLDPESATALFAQEYGCDRLSELWIAPDGASAVGHAGDSALVAWRAGDGYRLRRVAFDHLTASKTAGGRVRLKLDDPATPTLSFTVASGAWPPALWTAAAAEPT